MGCFRALGLCITVDSGETVNITPFSLALNWFKAHVRTGCLLQDMADVSVLLAVATPSALSGPAPSRGMPSSRLLLV